MTRKTTPERFWQLVDRSGACWVYPGKANHDGYVRVTVNGTKWMAHRYALTTLGRRIPSSMDVDHLCRNRACCRPSHLEVVTHAENMRRGQGRDRVNAAKTHCPQGHPYDELNTFVSAKGQRLCRACRRAQSRRAELKRKGTRKRSAA